MKNQKEIKYQYHLDKLKMHIYIKHVQLKNYVYIWHISDSVYHAKKGNGSGNWI